MKVRFVFLLILLLSVFVQAQSGITVTGSGTVYGEPDVAFIELGVNLVDEDITVATEQAKQRIDKLMELLSETGVASQDVRTSYFNIWTEEPYEGQPVRRYRVNNVLTVTVRDISKVGEILTKAIEAGANAVNSIQYSIAETRTLAAEARELAMQDARAKAEQLASLAAVSLGAVEMISDSSTPSSPGTYPGAEAMYSMDATPVTGGQLAVSAMVIVRFAILY